MMSETFYMFLITSSIGFFLAVARMCYKSKCSEVNFGCIKVVRNIDKEEVIDEIELNIASKRTEQL